MGSSTIVDDSNNVARVDLSDYVILLVVALGTIMWFTRGKLWAIKKQDVQITNVAIRQGSTRSIVDKMRESHKNAVVFYGSQTGTAEDYATRLAKEGHQRYGLQTMTADLDDYDYDDLDQFPADSVALFVIATYGEGEPTDNSVNFFDLLRDENSTLRTKGTSERPLENMSYVSFGLGNKTYEHYNEMIKICDTQLQSMGATRIGITGLGDDGDGTMEEDFLSWKEGMWEAVATKMNLQERDTVYEASYVISEDDTLSNTADIVYLGEPSKKHLTRSAKPFNANNPYFAPVSSSKELFTSATRNCIHVEVDIEGSGMKYRSGDHIAVWPMNPQQEVDRLLKILGLAEKRDQVISIAPIDVTSKVPIPQPTTYAACLTYYLEICGPVSRQFLSTLAQFSPSDAAKATVTRLSQDKDYFVSRIAKPHLNLAQMMASIADVAWDLPFSVILESLGRLQPRYYSISSSHLASPQVVSITAVVETKRFADHDNVLNGVTTNYLLALSQAKNGNRDPHPYGLSYDIEGPRTKYSGNKVPVHIRQSNFKLPTNPELPIVMVGPGTGVAPFRAFVQERALQCANGLKVGRMLLFFGCRRRDEDYLYAKEWAEFGQTLGSAFEIDVAFSRETNDKIYVQHRLAKRASEVKDLLSTGYFYLCGDASRMARDVNAELAKILGETALKQLKSTQRHQEDVWS